MRINKIIFTATFIVSTLLLEHHGAECKKRPSSHPHRGKIIPYKPGRFDMTVESKDEKILSGGKPVMKQIPDENDPNGGGKAICVQDIGAPKNAVWNQILGLNAYAGKVPKVKECKNYEVTRNADGSSTIKTKMVIGVLPGYKYESYYDHTFHPNDDSCVWSLDYDKYSDFDDVAGHWHIEDHPKKTGCTRVFYACDIKLRGAVPGPVMNILTKSALKSATSWVKKESEAAPASEMPSNFAFP